MAARGASAPENDDVVCFVRLLPTYCFILRRAHKRGFLRMRVECVCGAALAGCLDTHGHRLKDVPHSHPRCLAREWKAFILPRPPPTPPQYEPVHLLVVVVLSLRYPNVKVPTCVCVRAFFSLVFRVFLSPLVLLRIASLNCVFQTNKPTTPPPPPPPQRK